MPRRLSCLLAVTLAVGCGDEPLDDELLLGPTVSPSRAGGSVSPGPGEQANRVAANGPGAGTSAALANSMMYWDHEKAALRAGVVERDEWTGTNVGQGSFATGKNTTASFSYATAMGTGTTAVGFASAAHGKNTNATGDVATALGEETTAQAFLSLVIGRWNVISGNQVAWDDHDPLFVIGNGTDDGSRNNALVVRKEGDMELEGALVAGGDGFFSGDLTGDGLRLDDFTGLGMFALCADNLGNVVDCASSLQYKRDVRDLDHGLATVLHLRPRLFRWNDTVGGGHEDLGFIAEEVAALDPLLATHDNDGVPTGVKYRHMTALLARAIQELSQIVQAQNDAIAQREQENRRLRARVAANESSLQRLQRTVAERRR